MSRSSIFKKAVEDLLPSAIPVELDRVDEFAVGKVLVYAKKPRKLIPMRKHELEFTGWSVDSLLAEDQNLTITTARNYLFDAGKGTSSVHVKVNLDADLDLSKLSSLVGGSIEVQGEEDKVLNMVTDFGKITHVSSDLIVSMVGSSIHLKPDHPIVQKAIDHGGVIFLVHTIYEAEHVNMSVKLSKDVSESADETVKAVAKEEASEKVDDEHASSTAISRDQPTPLAYLVMKVGVDHKGKLSTKRNFSQNSKLQVGMNYTDDGRATDKTRPTGFPHTPTSDPYKDWVVVEIQKVSSSSAAPLTETPSKEEDQPVQAVKSAITTAAPPQGTTSGDAKPEAATPVPIATGDDCDCTILDDHFLYSMKDFQPFESKTYHGVLEEVKNWVCPFQSNLKLRDALIIYMKPPRTYERLNQLSSYFFELGDAMRSKKDLPPNTLDKVDPIIATLSEDPERRLDEISSVIVVAEAGDDFPQHIVEKIVTLSADKKDMLKELILETPYNAEIHAYPDIGPFSDHDLKPIMSRMGFKVQPGTSNLQYTRRVTEGEEDLLTAALVLLVASDSWKD